MAYTRTRRAAGWLMPAALLTLMPTVVSGAELRLLPSSARLEGPHARQRFVSERVEEDIGTADLTARSTFATDNPRVATVDRDGVVRPVGNGLAMISASVDGQVAKATISVEDHDRDEAWSFRNHVE